MAYYSWEGEEISSRLVLISVLFYFPPRCLETRYSRAPLLSIPPSLPFSHFCRASRMLIVARNARIEKKSAQFPIFYAIVITRWKFDL